MREIHVVGAAILHRGRCLVARRGPGMSLAGKWEFPGGKVEPGEGPREALAREIREELGLEIEVGLVAGRGTVTAGERFIVLDVYFAELTGGALALAEHSEVSWHAADTLMTLDWAEADVPVLESVRARLEAEPLSPTEQSSRP